ncbi:hypothetical protein HRI_002326600 [Hibiscus trionum]|uniref:DUF8040 domain-containing protein n=1 Tax=Hibiscus trionum TaxID=183268 RepID=A0A9W7I1R0_HIBTR|nr:hypothetical protein HRI_002326600 [Hibiscus trionum]
MARLKIQKKMCTVTILILQLEMMETMFQMLMLVAIALIFRKYKTRSKIRYAHEKLHRHNIRSINLHKIIFESDRQSVDNCRMDRRAFLKLCHLLKCHGGLKESRHMCMKEMVITFLHIIAHHTKNRVLKRQTARSGETISRVFHAVLNSVLKLHLILLRKPEPIQENSTDDRWKWFKDA